MLSPTRYRERFVADRAAAHAVLDEALFCHVGVVVDGRPHVLPTLHARVDDTLYVHGSSAARILATARSGPLSVCVTVSLLDGLVIARSAFHHSLNYRSVVVHGAARLVTDAEEKSRMLDALVDRVGTARSAQCRPPTAKELAATSVLAVDLAAETTDVALKVRTGGPLDDEADLELGHWAGVVPVRLVAGSPEPACDLPIPTGLAPSLR
ncbi:pyridoxamine 5'-phosphate oxidase family protein [Frankia sp. AgB1.9]|uniref:pyridoxamine 5'-phosphate oxidase family protein n=1 Tax=unclassified Frankia TaxID=2632575 RepID=UPI00193139FB|nr:pyridoxamine 5'-phosphate oxidase family protein [Frankia sp. AgW1.1]MBL7489496.1 pyridoxamine 5'-phosphate oxidase family protein [Frankia sp. AgW1.1]MBL7547774.1 pyridoxamine 5'-phosphate oxidase family protein [Frankia sp. AgB1.9]MBL7621270.1 pyridoxamine 5'-phosphate oxidase family protein [Frankia sp. AgB1.8]